MGLLRIETKLGPARKKEKKNNANTYCYFGGKDEISNMLPSERPVVSRAGMKMAMRITDTEPFRSLGTRMWPRHFPGCEEHGLWSDPYLECLVRRFTTALWHPSGTCSMGTGPAAVVDNELRYTLTRTDVAPPVKLGSHCRASNRK